MVVRNFEFQSVSGNNYKTSPSRPEPWWWLSGQRARLLFLQFKLNPAQVDHFSLKLLMKKTKINVKRPWLAILKNVVKREQPIGVSIKKIGFRQFELFYLRCKNIGSSWWPFGPSGN